MELLVTGGDTELGRVIASGFRDEGHNVMIAGAQRAELEVAAKELDVDYVVFDNNDPRQPRSRTQRVPPAPGWHHQRARPALGRRRPPDPHPDRPRVGLAPRAGHHGVVRGPDGVGARRPAELGRLDHQRGRRPTPPTAARTPPSRRPCRTGPAGQAAHFGIRGITINLVAAGRGVDPGYDGLGGTPPPTADEITRLALFLTTPSARHITGETLHVSQGALASFG